jgi:hypothetical protein
MDIVANISAARATRSAKRKRQYPGWAISTNMLVSATPTPPSIQRIKSPRSLTPTLPDPDDEVFLAAALVAPDQILVTGNAARFPEKLCRPVRILTPAIAIKLP